MRSGTFLFLLAASLSACAAVPELNDPSGSANDATEGDGGSSSSSSKKDAGSTAKDAGKSASSSSSGASSSSSTRSDGGSKAPGSDAGISLPDLSGILNGFGATSDASVSSSGDGGLVASCENLFCFDIFDCAIFHTDKLDCGFTKCEGFICKK